MQQERVGEGRWCGADAFAGGLDGRHGGETFVDALIDLFAELVVGEHGGVLMGDFAKEPLAGVLRAATGFGGVAELAAGRFGKVQQHLLWEPLAAKLGHEGVGPADDAADGALAAFAVAALEGDREAGKGAGLADERPKLAAGFPPAVVAGIVAETEKDGKCDAEQGERSDAETTEGRGVKMPEPGDGCGKGGDEEDLPDSKQLPHFWPGPNDHDVSPALRLRAAVFLL